MDALGFLTVKEVAPLIGMSESWIYVMLRAGHGPPHFRRGKKYVFRRDEIEHWSMERIIDGVGSLARENPKK